MNMCVSIWNVVYYCIVLHGEDSSIPIEEEGKLKHFVFDTIMYLFHANTK